jgi:hypothetical protein
MDEPPGLFELMSWTASPCRPGRRSVPRPVRRSLIQRPALRSLPTRWQTWPGDACGWQAACPKRSEALEFLQFSRPTRDNEERFLLGGAARGSLRGDP